MTTTQDFTVRRMAHDRLMERGKVARLAGARLAAKLFREGASVWSASREAVARTAGVAK